MKSDSIVSGLEGRPIRPEFEESELGFCSFHFWFVSGHAPENVPCVQTWVCPIILGNQRSRIMSSRNRIHTLNL